MYLHFWFQEVDIAAAALTISDERLSAIDFSHAFHHSAITCLIQKPSPFRSLEHMVECAESGKVRLTFTGGATRRFFKTTEVPLYKRILIVVEQELNPPRNADQAVQMVRIYILAQAGWPIRFKNVWRCL